jgi:hypothetical protein
MSGAAVETGHGLPRRALVVAVPAVLGAAVLLTMHLLAPNFFRPQNLLNVLVQTSSLGVMAIGMTFVMLGGGIDLSIPATMACAAVLGAFAMPAGGRRRGPAGDAGRRRRDRAVQRRRGRAARHAPVRRDAGDDDRRRRGDGVADQFAEPLGFPGRLLRPHAGPPGIRFVQQELNMLSSMAVAENALIDDFPMRGGRIDRGAARTRVNALLARLQRGFGPDDPVETLGMGDRSARAAPSNRTAACSVEAGAVSVGAG